MGHRGATAGRLWLWTLGSVCPMAAADCGPVPCVQVVLSVQAKPPESVVAELFVGRSAALFLDFLC